MTKPKSRGRSAPKPKSKPNRFYQSCAHCESFETHSGRTVTLPVTLFPLIDDEREFWERFIAFIEPDGGVYAGVPTTSATRPPLRSQQVVEIKIAQNTNKRLLPYFKRWLDHLGIRSSTFIRAKCAELRINGPRQIQKLLTRVRDVCGDIPMRGYKYRSLLIVELLLTAELDDHARVDAIYSINKPDRHTPDKRDRRKWTRERVEATYGLGPTWGTCAQLEAVDRRYRDRRRALVDAGAVSGLWVTIVLDGDGTISSRPVIPLLRSPGGIRHSGRAGFVVETFALTNLEDVMSALGWINPTLERKPTYSKRVTTTRANLIRLIDHYRVYPPLSAIKRAQLSCLIAGLELSPTAPLQDHIDYVSWVYDVSAVVRSTDRTKPLDVVIDELRCHYRDHPWIEDTELLVGDPDLVWRSP